MSKSEPRIVVRRRRPHVSAEHGGSWKIAYADFMTAMMAFFLVMWLLAIVPQKDLHTIAEYFRMPLITAITTGPSVSSRPSVIPGGEPSAIPNVAPRPAPRPNVHEDGDRRDVERLENLKAELDALIRTDPVLKAFRPQLLLDMTPDGLRIQIIDRQNRPMFSTGSAQVQPYMRDILRQLGPTFNKLPNRISISGHTDSIQYANGERGYSNWELSADRANAARQELVQGGMDEAKVKRVIGLSSSVSLIKDDPAAAVNRRISIVVLNRRAERRIDQQYAIRTDTARLRELLEPAGDSPAADTASADKPLSASPPGRELPAEGLSGHTSGDGAQPAGGVAGQP
ncbi:flagellar motor protein MotB [Allopusillimonas soli]|uniref:Flagellar motor protein MotB n=1 Tax=Allopusillimonas soli TaxID=659016 RepID=A0A853F9C6_9BURK|nr:flagellar motor protein MotB [Allopusillimonas soli]NYT35540.1 flagellar motor protein MotB [Allopusillimonas soli]TEA75945.1 flagellar motor protein MotB [Allopusillimonas soli]